MLGVAERTLLWSLGALALAGAAWASPAVGAVTLNEIETAPAPVAPNEPAGPPDPAETPPWLFDPATVVEIDLTLSPEEYAELEAEPEEYVDGELAVSVNGDDYGPVAAEIRLKGSTSFRTLDAKAAFKLKFEERFLGLKKLTLNNMVQDPSMLHERLAYELFRSALVAAPRTGYAFVRVNGDAFGLYLNVETLDDVALERWFSSTGHLYEGEYGADVTPDAVDGLAVDEGDEDDRADVEALTAALAAPTPGLPERLDGLVDLDQMTRMWAVERYVGHWDGYTATPAPELWPNNYYLHSDGEGVFSMLPWGTDQTFVNRVAFDGPGGALFNACLGDAECRKSYLDYLYVMPALARDLRLGPLAAETAATLADWQALDPRREHTLDQIAAGVAATRAFIQARPGDLYDLDYWLPRSSPPPQHDVTAPETRIIRAPRGARTARKRASVRIAFSSSELASSFQCRLDSGPWRPCRSPLRLRVRRGRHVLRVRAVDLAGNVDPSPARHRWTVGRKRR